MSKFYPSNTIGALKRVSDQQFDEHYQLEQGIVRSAGFGGLIKVQMLGSGTYTDVQADGDFNIGDSVSLYRQSSTNRWIILSAQSDGNSTVLLGGNTTPLITTTLLPPQTISAFGATGIICCWWSLPPSSYDSTYEIELSDSNFNGSAPVQHLRVSGGIYIYNGSPQSVSIKYFRVRTINKAGQVSEWTASVVASSLVDSSIESFVTYHSKWALTTDFSFGGTLSNDSRFVNFSTNIINDLFAGSNAGYYEFSAPFDSTYTFNVSARLDITSTSSHLYTISVIDTSTNTVLQTIYSQSQAATVGASLFISHMANVHLLSGQTVAIRLRYDEVTDGDNTLTLVQNSYVDISWQGVRQIAAYQAAFVPNGGIEIEICKLKVNDTLLAFWVRSDGLFVSSNRASIGITANHELLVFLDEIDLSCSELHHIPRLYKASGDLSVKLFCDNSSGATRIVEIGIDAKLR